MVGRVHVAKSESQHRLVTRAVPFCEGDRCHAAAPTSPPTDRHPTKPQSSVSAGDLPGGFATPRYKYRSQRYRRDVARPRTGTRRTRLTTGGMTSDLALKLNVVLCMLLLKIWLRPLVVGLSLWIGTCAGSWATMRWLARSIQTRIEMAAGLDRDIEDARRTLAQLEEDTWGIVFHEIKGERFVVVPEGVLADPAWKVDERPALKLSNE